MPREPKTDRSSEVPSAAPSGLIAAASRLAGPGVKKKQRKPINPEAWQTAAWQFYDTVSELHFAANWVGNLMSKAILEVRYDGKVVEQGVGWDALQLFYGGPDAQPEMLRQYGIHATIAGECYVVGEDGGASMQDRWWTVAATEMTRQGDVWKRDGKELDDPLVMRLWKPHPRRYKESDSPTRAVLPILSELDWLTKSVAADLSSRAAGRGILAIPSEIEFAGGPVTTNADGTTTSPSSNAVITELMETMMLAMEDPESAAAAVPLLFQGPAEFLDKIQHIMLSSDLQEKAVELREEAIRRIGIGMDMPPEALTGQGEMNHWSAWQADESAIKIHTEPLLRVLTSSLTDGYLRPYVEYEDGEDEAERWTITADTSGMRTRPNRSKESIELYNLGELSSAAMRRENGFEESDAPDPLERKLWHLRKLATGTTTPEAVQAAYELLGISLPIAEVEAPEAGDPERPTPSLKEHPTRDMPDTEDEASLAAAVAAAEIMVHRTLERAGNRMKGRGSTPFPHGVAAADFYLHHRPRDTEQLDAIMSGCWEFVGRFDYGIPHERFTAALDAYTRGLLRTGRPYRRAELRQFIAAVRDSETSPRVISAKMAIERAS